MNYYHVTYPNGKSPLVFDLMEAIQRARRWEALTRVPHSIAYCPNPKTGQIWDPETFSSFNINDEDLRRYVQKFQ